MSDPYFLERTKRAVAEIAAICDKYDIMLIGTCSSEEIMGEITIEDKYKNPADHEPGEFEMRVNSDGEVQIEKIGSMAKAP